MPKLFPLNPHKPVDVGRLLIRPASDAYRRFEIARQTLMLEELLQGLTVSVVSLSPGPQMRFRRQMITLLAVADFMCQYEIVA